MQNFYYNILQASYNKYIAKRKMDSNRHKMYLTQILPDIYSDRELALHFGVKGGTAAMLFYGLPCFLVDKAEASKKRTLCKNTCAKGAQNKNNQALRCCRS
ncbi:MAG: hypothetical protein LBJ57_05220 [Prevotellaceae bacterium]|jgi:hypothetical protein|nr:hypothetical protein [Prevotellaceae bacterium]